MPKKKGHKNKINRDFTINDCANAPKPVTKLKKSTSTDPAPADISWDQIQDDDFEIVEEINEDGTKNFVYQKKKCRTKSESNNVDESPGKVYPEIVWYHISKFVRPEDVGRFAGINKATYSLTKREYFWRSLYKDYCEKHPLLPEALHLENNYKVHGLRQRVIRALYCTYDMFVQKVLQQKVHDSRPHPLVKRRCVNMWFCKGRGSMWSVYFKLKKQSPIRRMEATGADYIEELGRVDANPEEDTQVLEVTCESFNEVTPLMGMILSSVSVVLTQGFRHHRLHLGFNTGLHVSRDILPECSIVLDRVVNMMVFDWWHPRYPFFESRIPITLADDESLPMLKRDFFAVRESHF